VYVKYTKKLALLEPLVQANTDKQLCYDTKRHPSKISYHYTDIRMTKLTANTGYRALRVYTKKPYTD